MVINFCVIAKIAMNDTNYVWMCMGQKILSSWILFANVSNCLLELLTTWAIIFIWEKVLDENVKVLTSFLFFILCTYAILPQYIWYISTLKSNIFQEIYNYYLEVTLHLTNNGQNNNYFLNWISALVKEMGGYFFPYCKIHFYG